MNSAMVVRSSSFLAVVIGLPCSRHSFLQVGDISLQVVAVTAQVIDQKPLPVTRRLLPVPEFCVSVRECVRGRVG